MTRFNVALLPGGIEPLKWTIRRTCTMGDEFLTAYYSKDDNLILLHILTTANGLTTSTVSTTVNNEQASCLLAGGDVTPGNPVTDFNMEIIEGLLNCLVNEQRLTNLYLSEIIDDTLEL